MVRNCAIPAVVLLVGVWQAHAFVPASSTTTRRWFAAVSSRPSHSRKKNANRLFYRNQQQHQHGQNETTTISTASVVEDRFARTAPQKALLDKPCVLTIDGVRYNVTSWGRSCACRATYH